MTAQIIAFDTRAQIGLRPPDSVSHNITPAQGGSAVHYGGGGTTGITEASSHDKCRAQWRAWQNYHMDTKGWVDIAYTGGFCQHGYAMAGRGMGVRTAANGTNDANQRFYAFVFVGCADDTPTTKALDALDWWLVEARRNGAGLLVKPHSTFFSTACPGGVLRSYAITRDGKSIPAPYVPPPPPPPPASPPPAVYVKRTPRAVGVVQRGSTGPLVVVYQRILYLTADGIYGPKTESAVRLFQQGHGLTADGDIGPLTARALLAVQGNLSRGDTGRAVYLLQWIGNLVRDGVFGASTDTATRQMQTWAGLPADGIVGPLTRAKIVR